jgi:hypothetical protein
LKIYSIFEKEKDLDYLKADTWQAVIGRGNSAVGDMWGL